MDSSRRNENSRRAILAAAFELAGEVGYAKLCNERYDLPMRALSAEIMNDAELARMYAERLDEPVRELKKDRLRKAVTAGQLSDVDLDMAVDLIWGRGRCGGCGGAGR